MNGNTLKNLARRATLGNKRDKMLPNQKQLSNSETVLPDTTDQDGQSETTEIRNYNMGCTNDIAMLQKVRR